MICSFFKAASRLEALSGQRLSGAFDISDKRGDSPPRDLGPAGCEKCAPPSAAPLEILPRQQPEPRAIETRVMPPMDHSRGESLESPHGVEVYRDVAAGD